jgi:hypothetical protein
MTTYGPERRSFRDAIAANTGLRCAAPGCAWSRDKVSRYCASHDKRNESTGAPNGNLWLPSFWKPYVAAASRFLDANAGHPSLVAAADYLQGKLEGAPEGSVLCRVLANGHTGRDVLVRVLAAAAFRLREPPAFPNARNWQANLAASVMRLAAVRTRGRTSEQRKRDRIKLGLTARLRLADELTAGPMIPLAARALPAMAAAFTPRH